MAAPSTPRFCPADGLAAVRLARAAAARALGGPAEPEGAALAPGFRERGGAFVSWYGPPGDRLRGCVGFPEPVLELAEAVREAAVAAAVEDPRFPPVTLDELARLVAEVSLLSPLEPVAAAERPDGVVVGRDGVVVERGRARGLLLPQVAVEQGWDAAELLDGACEKAGLAAGTWREAATRVFRFRAEVFREARPNGPVAPVALEERRRP